MTKQQLEEARATTSPSQLDLLASTSCSNLATVGHGCCSHASQRECDKRFQVSGVSESELIDVYIGIDPYPNNSDPPLFSSPGSMGRRITVKVSSLDDSVKSDFHQNKLSCGSDN